MEDGATNCTENLRNSTGILSTISLSWRIFSVPTSIPNHPQFKKTFYFLHNLDTNAAYRFENMSLLFQWNA